MSRLCACRRELTESELMAAYSGIGSARIAQHDEPPCVPEPAPMTAQLVRERYAAWEQGTTVLTRLKAAERRLTVGGRW